MNVRPRGEGLCSLGLARFATWDSWHFSPLCFLLATGFFVLFAG